MFINVKDIRPIFDIGTSSTIQIMSGSSNKVATVDDAFLENICDFYIKRHEKEKYDNLLGSMWFNIISKQHEEVMNLLLLKNIKNLKEYLDNMATNSLTDGILQGPIISNALNNKEYKQAYIFFTYSRFILLLQYLNIIPLFNPEDAIFNERQSVYFNFPIDDYIDIISDKLNFNFFPPQYLKSLFGLATKYGVYSWRDIVSLGVALIISEKYKDKSIKICEIGGGCGHLAFYLNKMGYINISIVDLPTISVAQMYFLGTNLPNHNIKFLSISEYNGNYDLIINIDSFTEMTFNIADEYIKKIKKGANLISINHEINTFKVIDVCKKNNMIRNSKNLFWFRKGYVFEEYIKE